MIKDDPSVVPLLEKMAYKPPSAPNPADANNPAAKEPQSQ
jgi:hypothetical protein